MSQSKFSAPPPLSETHPHLKEFSAFLPKLNEESARGAVLISCAFIDELLQRTLLSFFLDHKIAVSLVDGFNAPLGTFSTRASAAFALGLISEEEYEETDTLRKIRNSFAHDIHVDFEDEKIAALCNKLLLAAKDYGDVVVSSRGQFTSSATCIILRLVNRPHYVEQKRRSHVNWPY